MEDEEFIYAQLRKNCNDKASISGKYIPAPRENGLLGPGNGRPSSLIGRPRETDRLLANGRPRENDRLLGIAGLEVNRWADNQSDGGFNGTVHSNMQYGTNQTSMHFGANQSMFG